MRVSEASETENESDTEQLSISALKHTPLCTASHCKNSQSGRRRETGNASTYKENKNLQFIFLVLFLSHVDALGNSFIWGVRILEGTFLPQTSPNIQKTKQNFEIQKDSDERLFILTRTHSMQSFGKIPLIKPQNDT